MNLISEIFSGIGRFLLSSLEYINFFDLFSKGNKDDDDNDEVYENKRFK